MAKNTDIACLFVLLRNSSVGSEYALDRSIDKIWYYFPERDKSRLKTLCKKLLEQLYHPDLYQVHEKTFRALPFDQRYRIGVEAVAKLSSDNNILINWYKAYSRAQISLFSAEELPLLKLRIKASIESIRTSAKYTLERENQHWEQWNIAQNSLILRQSIWRDPEDVFSVICHNKDNWYGSFVLCLQATNGTARAVTRQEVCLWGVTDAQCIEQAIKNGIYMYEDSDLVPHPQKEAIESVLKEGDSSSVSSVTDKEQAINEMLGLVVNSIEVTKLSPVSSTKCQSTSKTKAKPKAKSLAVLQRSLQKEWHTVYSELSNVSFENTILDQKRVEYRIKSQTQNRKATAKKNIKSFSDTLRNIEVLLIECLQAIKTTGSIDTAFDLLCFISHEVVAFEELLAKLNALYGYMFQTDPAISEIRNESFAHYVSLLQEKVRNAFAMKKKLSTDTQKLAQQHRKISADIEKHRISITQAMATLQEDVQHHEEMQSSCREQQPLIERDIAELNAALETVNNCIVSLEGSIAADEESFTEATAQMNELYMQMQVSQRDKEQHIAQDQLKTAALQAQITEAEAVIQKTLFFKKAKIQRVDELRASLAKHQEEMHQQITRLEEQLASLKKAHDVLADQTSKLTATQAESRDKLTYYIQEKAALLQRIEARQADLLKLESETTASAANVATKQEALQKKEEELEVLLSQLDDCAKAMECSRNKETDFDSEIIEKIQVYPSNFARLEVPITVDKISEYAFSSPVLDVINAAKKSSAQITMLENQRLHMQALQQSLAALVDVGTISPDNVDLSIGSMLKDIEDRLQQFAVDTVRCKAAFDITVDSANDRPSNGVVKKARKLFAAYWTLVTEGAFVPQELQPVLDGARYLQVSDDYHLFFTPFYVVALEQKKRSRIEMELVEYTAISLEAAESQISLGYGQECPDGATIIRERWQYETVNGAPNRRYTNNQSYYVVALNGVKLVINGREKITYYKSAEEVEKTLQAYDDFRSFLYNENADVMEAIFDCNQIPDVILITTEIAESRKKEESDRKEQERQLKQQEIKLRKQREEEKRQKELHQKRLELWADNAQKKKAEDDLLVSQRPDLLSPITAVELANWDELQSMPVSITAKRRVITTGITKVEFIQQENVVGTTKYLVFFTDETGKEFSDVRTLVCSPVGTTSVIPFEIKTQSIANPTILYLLVRDMDTGKLVGKFEYRMNIAFTNDFDF